MQFNYSDLDTVYTEVSVEETLPAHVQKGQARRVFLVASRSLAQATDQFAALRRNLGEHYAGMTTAIRPHTPRSDVMTALAQVRETGADLLVSLGGGSVIDACKVIQLAMNQKLMSEEALLAFAQRADGSRGARFGQALNNLGVPPNAPNLGVPQMRQVAVPTTLSGAEFSNNAGVLDMQANAKEGYRATGLCPQAIVYDPALSCHTPQWLLLSTAIRSLDHAIEGYCSADTTDYHDGQFLHGIALFAKSLPSIRLDAKNLQARAQAQTAVWSSCCGLGTISHGASHGIGYVLGSLHGVPHGMTSCVMLPAVLQWNEDHLGDRLARVSDALGDAHTSAFQLVKRLVTGLDLPTSLQALGIKKQDLDGIAARAIRHPVVGRNPKPINKLSQVREILDLAWS